MDEIDLLIHSAGQLCTIPGNSGPQRGHNLGELGIIKDGAIAVRGERIIDVGPTAEIQDKFQAVATLDAEGRCLVPGFIDPHTHIPWFGDRADEFERRLAGVSYMEIMASGGGIMSTVSRTRSASLEALVDDNLPRLERMLAFGTTSAEAKSGYGLDLDSELKQLDAIALLDQKQPIELAATFLPAHAVPAEYQGRTDEYVAVVVNEMLPAAATWMEERNLVLFCDVFCEEGVFNLEQTAAILQRAGELGFKLKLHADEFVGLGGTNLAVSLGAVSVDHLVATPEADIEALGKGHTVAVSLPGTPFGLAHEHYTPAAAILEKGGILALATDCNPGTSWCESMQMIMALACRYLGLTQAQALVASTLNAAYAIGRGHEIGSLTPGRQADILILECSDYRHLGYRYGTNLVKTVVKKGKVVVSN